MQERVRPPRGLAGAAVVSQADPQVRLTARHAPQAHRPLNPLLEQLGQFQVKA